MEEKKTQQGSHFDQPQDEKSRQESAEIIIKDMTLDKIKTRMEVMQVSLVKDMEYKLGAMVEDLMDEVKRYNMQNGKLKDLFNEEQNDRKKSDRAGALPEKHFMPRNSLLTDLFEVKHIRTLYHIFIVIVIVMFLNMMMHDFVAEGRFNIGLRPIIVGFGKFNVALMVWTTMQASVILMYYAFKLWANLRGYVEKDAARKMFDIACTSLLVSFYLFFLPNLTVAALLKYDLATASSVAILMELVRFMMKCHAFVRSNYPRVIAGSGKKHADAKPQTSCLVPDIKRYLFFLFAPTLIYRDEYPRTRQIRWGYVAKNIMEVFGVVLCISVIFERHLMPIFHQFGEREITAASLVLAIFSCMMPGIMCFLCGFYCLLHSWMNAWAEVLRFADRMFYKDWWNANSFPHYYRTWNIVVHDWLYTYIYKDVYEYVFKGYKTASMLTVFAISAIFHEFIMGVAFRFLYPVMFFFFGGVSVLLMFVKNKKYPNLGNMMLWLCMCLGNGMMLSLYNMEYYARTNCVLEGKSMAEYLIPVSWYCNGIAPNPDWEIKAPWQELNF